MFKTMAAICGVLCVVGATESRAAGIRGEYVEARTCDVFTGPCFSNAEVFITGHQAVMAWKVNEGAYQGTDLKGLTVAAAIRADSTLDTDIAKAAKVVLLVDKRASEAQRKALIAMAKELGGERMENIVEVRSTAMSLIVEHKTAEPASLADPLHNAHKMPQAPSALFIAQGVAQISTRPLDDRDHKCGNEVLAYPPLSKGVDVLPAFTIDNMFNGKGLNTRWDDQNARSSMVGRFTL